MLPRPPSPNLPYQLQAGPIGIMSCNSMHVSMHTTYVRMPFVPLHGIRYSAVSVGQRVILDVFLGNPGCSDCMLEGMLAPPAQIAY